MAFIEIAPDRNADEEAARLFAEDEETLGFVANHTRLFARRPAVSAAWDQLRAAIKANMDPRRYELATLAAATAYAYEHDLV
jgi:alkylhydroperoxidase/carboxymuconolactone decarboxylase family protein YurZ